MNLEFTILGSGTSMGVPVLGCSCPVCSSDDPKDTRSRASLLLEAEGLSILFDTATEFRLQALAAGVDHLDAVFFTHAHADHIHGIDDLRPLNHHRPIPIYGSARTLGEIERRFSYIFHRSTGGGAKPHLTLNPIPEETGAEVRLERDPVLIEKTNVSGKVDIVPIPVYHGELPIFGFRVGSFAYLTDCNFIPEESYHLLEGVGVVVIDALRFRSHPTHFNIEQALEAVDRIGAHTAFLTHLCHEVGYGELLDTLPAGVYPAYDGLRYKLKI